MSTTALQMLYITSCTDPLMWYSDQVGQFVPLLRRLPEGGWGSQEPDGHRNIVKRLDAEEVTVMVPREKLGAWPHIQPAHKLVHIVRKDVAERARKWPQQAELTPGQVPNPSPWPKPPEQGRQCRDFCMLGACQKLSHCLEAKADLLADLRKDIQAETDMLNPSTPSAGQSRRASMVETVANLVIGFIVSLLITAAVLPLYGHHVTVSENIQITAIFTVASLLRSYGLRRLFNLFSSQT